MKVSLYVREHASRKFTPINRKKIYPEGTIYVLRYNQRWHTIPGCTSITLALTAQKQKELELLQGAPVKTVKTVKTPTERVTVTAAVKKYLDYISKTKSHKTYLAYSLALRLFVASCTKEFLDEITKDDLRVFEAAQFEADYDARTVDNRLTHLISFLRYHEIYVKHHCAYVERKVKAYSNEQLNVLAAISTPEELEIWEFFLHTGFREQETAHAHYTDIDWELKRIVPRCKPEHGDWIPKDKEERGVPIPDTLIASLLARRERMGGSDGLIFPNGHGTGVEGHYLRLLQDRVKAAGLDVSEYTLHKYRKSFATWHYRRGVSERTIQKWLGHSNITTTQLYLADEKDNTPEIREKVNSAFVGLLVRPDAPVQTM